MTPALLEEGASTSIWNGDARDVILEFTRKGKTFSWNDGLVQANALKVDVFAELDRGCVAYLTLFPM